MNTAQKAQSFLNEPNSHLGKIWQRAKQIQQLDQLIKKHLDAKLAAHCHVCNLQNGRISIITNNAAIAMRLKQQFPTLLNTLRQLPGFQGLSGIDCKISPDWK